MIVCPVCEHQQSQGAECEVCGKKLVHGAAAIPRVAAVEGLEPTGHAAVDAPPERVPGLEPTGHAAAGEVQGTVPDMESGRAAPVDVEAPTIPGVERVTDGVPGAGPPVIPSMVVCRYCRTTAMPGERICTRCGMRLPSFDGAAAGAGRAAGAGPDAEARICSCGTPVRGSSCPNCGARVR